MKKFITNGQISMILYCIVSGYSIMNIPKRVAESAGTSGWILLLIATFIFILIAYVITYLQYVYEGKTLYEYSQRLIGRFLTYIVSVLYILYFFMNLTMTIRIYCETIRLTLLTKTPVVYLSLLVYIVVTYALLQGLNVIARLCEIYGFISFINTIIISTILFTQGEIVNIRPLFAANNITIYFKELLQMILPLLGIEILLFIPIHRKSNKNLFKYTMILMGFMGIFLIYIVEAVFSIGGISLIINSKATLFIVAKGVNVPYLEFFRRFDGIYIVVWTMNSVCSTSMWGYGTVTVIHKILKNIKYKVMVIIIITVSFIISLLPKTTKQVELILDFNSYFGCIVIFIIPCILLFITKVKKYDKNIF